MMFPLSTRLAKRGGAVVDNHLAAKGDR